MRRLILAVAAVLLVAGLVVGGLAIANYRRYTELNSLGESHLAAAEAAVNEADAATANRSTGFAESIFEDARQARAGTGILAIISLVSLSGGSAMLWSQIHATRRSRRRKSTEGHARLRVKG